MTGRLIGIVDDDEATRTELEAAVRDIGYETFAGSWSDEIYDAIQRQQPALLIVHVPLNVPPTDDIMDLLERDERTRRIPKLICTDNTQLRPSAVHDAVQSEGQIQASSSSVDEILAKLQLMLSGGNDR